MKPTQEDIDNTIDEHHGVFVLAGIEMRRKDDKIKKLKKKIQILNNRINRLGGLSQELMGIIQQLKEEIDKTPSLVDDAWWDGYYSGERHAERCAWENS